MTGYTTGEWRVIETNLSLHESDYVADLSNGLMVVSDAKLGDARADADLISAAPNMLDALYAAALYFVKGDKQSMDVAEGKLLAAIYKATGQS